MNGQLTQSGVSDTFRMAVPLYVDFGNGPMFFAAARVTGNKSIDLKGIVLPQTPKKLSIGALSDILAEKIDIVKQ